jgi:adenylyltransferase/sulfurtransferase
MADIAHLEKKIASLESELAGLRALLATSKEMLPPPPHSERKWPLEEHDYQRYGRQMIVPNFGLQGSFSLPPLSEEPR